MKPKNYAGKTKKEILSLILESIEQGEKNQGFKDYQKLYEEMRNELGLSEDDYSEAIYDLERALQITREFGFNFDKLRMHKG